MGSTEPSIEPLGFDDLSGALALSLSANWNQNEADWRSMLTLGRGHGIRAADDGGVTQLAASVIVLPYGEHFAWVSMVLVLPDFRRRGYASLLLRHALAELSREGRAAILDATPAGHAVYVQEGFTDTWGFARYRREARPDARATMSAATRPLRESDWPEIEALDAPAFGASRTPLLRTLAQRLPSAARVAEQGGRVVGFVLGRDGREATQIGPLIAADDTVAKQLLGDVLRTQPGPLYLDLLDRRQALLPWLQSEGFVFQRPFTRMVHGRRDAPGDPATIVLAAGPELG
ncbi:MAG TPA: GNAT family N-acetyltransferase [Burkholderiaceae bacterium]|nr:GNAT family N-acetyltransferase [Burkholderiaceae bacterium]